MIDLEQQAALDMLTDQAIVEYLTEQRKWGSNIVPTGDGLQERYLVWSKPWPKAVA